MKKKISVSLDVVIVIVWATDGVPMCRYYRHVLSLLVYSNSSTKNISLLVRRQYSWLKVLF